MAAPLKELPRKTARQSPIPYEGKSDTTVVGNRRDVLIQGSLMLDPSAGATGDGQG
jgi:hypothetical protein